MRSPRYPTDVPAPLRVLEVHRPPAPRVRYIDQIVGSGESELDFEYSNINLFRSDVDVVHIHRLDAFVSRLTVGSVVGAWKDVAKAACFAAMLRRHRIALVQTLHDPDSARSRRWPARLASQILDRATTAYVVLDETTTPPCQRPATLIPHAHYRDRFMGYPRGERVHGRVLCIDSEELDGKAERLPSIFRVTETPGLSLRLVGPATASLAKDIQRATATRRSCVSAVIERVSDGTMVKEIDAAEIVLMPATDTLVDLNLLFVALSLERPVMVPGNDVMQLLAEEVGPGWVHGYSGPLTAAVIDEAIRSLRAAPPCKPPVLDGRDLDVIAAKYAELFEAAARSAGRRSGQPVVGRARR